MAIDWSIQAIGLEKKFIKQMARLKKLGYLNLGPKDLKLADELSDIAKARFKTYFFKQITRDYPVKARVCEAIHVSGSVYTKWTQDPRITPARTIGLISLMDSRYKNAITAFRQVEDYFFSHDPEMPGTFGMVKESEQEYKISRLEELAAEMKRVAEGRISE